jgi:hypothetical protein
VSVTVTRKDKNWLKKLRDANKGHGVLAVGYPVGSTGVSTKYPDGTPVILVAAANNFGANINHPGGTPYVMGGDGMAHFVGKDFTGPVHGVTAPHNIKIPRRDFMGPGGKLAIENTRGIVKTMVPKINAGKATKGDALKIIGPVAESAFKTAIEQIKTPPNAASTIAKKRSDNPLEDTGLMKNTLTHVVRDA